MNSRKGMVSGTVHDQRRGDRAATIWAAEAHFEENIKGSIEAGKLADSTVIDKDVMTCDESELKDINT